jgi:hypothetical protein
LVLGQRDNLLAADFYILTNVGFKGNFKLELARKEGDVTEEEIVRTKAV